MNAYTYDLHLHSCLSPCGDDDMTPANIAGMATLAGLQIAALTDHNSCKNCPAFFKACKSMGIIPIPGMELTTAEDIHIITLFDSLEKAMAFDADIEKVRIPVPNKVDIFGNQLIMDEDDNVIGTEPNLLINATTLSIDRAVKMAREHGAAVYPAHVDRQGNGIIAVLGSLPETPHFDVVEFRDIQKIPEYEKLYPNIVGKMKVTGSDSHILTDIPDAKNTLLLEDEPYSGALVRENLLKLLKESR